MAGWLSWERWHFLLLLLYIFFLYMPYAVCVRIWTTHRSNVRTKQEYWSKFCVWMCRLELKPLPGSQPVSKRRRTMILGNHRNFTDFFLHDVITDFTANFLSRALVGVVFFFFAISTYLENTVWFFVRGRAREDPEL